jgi:topoisomerase-4 subunit B
MNAKLKKSTPEVIFSVLHAGGKFGGNGYKTSGGLHGVGSSVVNALSSKFNVKIYRDGKISEIKFSDGGKVKEPLTKVGTSNKTGTIINFLPDKSIFSTTRFSFSTIATHLKEAALLNSGLKITLNDLHTQRNVTYQFENGLQEFVKSLANDANPITPIISLTGKEKDILVEIVFEYTDDYNENLLGFANNVKTIDGGTHLTGFRIGLTRVVNDYARKIGMLKDKDKNFTSDDLKEGLVAIVSLKIPENLIQYEGQTKGKLGTSEARYATESIVVKQLGFWFEENKTNAINIIDKALLARKARDEARKARQAARQSKGKNRTKNQMLGKLTPANGRDKKIAELYLVEGDSAGGSAKAGRDAKFQAILPLRGKVINSEKAKLEDLLKNEEINVIINAIGAGIGGNFDLEDANYGKIVIMTDADTDGAHIQTLLLTFFYRYMKPLILEKHIFIALPPLYKIRFTDGKIKYF